MKNYTYLKTTNSLKKEIDHTLMNFGMLHCLQKQKSFCNTTNNHTQNKLARFLHACCFSPIKHTLIKENKRGNFTNWPGLITDLIYKYLPSSITTDKGHMQQEQQNIQSTRIIIFFTLHFCRG